jgi:hypothetical protein
MAFATISLIPTKIEPLFWLAVFITCSWFIVKNVSGRYFLHGFVLSLINCIYIVAAHVFFYHAYIVNHPEMAQMNSQMPLSTHPRIMMIIMGPVFGIIFGLVQGLIAFIMSKIIKKDASFSRTRKNNTN